jgi:hypothetical protein
MTLLEVLGEMVAAAVVVGITKLALLVLVQPIKVMQVALVKV